MNVRPFLVKASSPLVFALSVIGCSSASEPSDSVEGATVVEQLPVEGEQTCGAAHVWAEANAAHLPTSYDAFVRYSTVYRKAIFSAATPDVKARLWTEHLHRYRAEHDLTAEQRSVLERTLRLVESNLVSWEQPGSSLPKDLELDALKAFGHAGVRELLAMLGPTNDKVRAASQESSLEDCECSVSSDYCSGIYVCKFWAHGGCNWKSIGCGNLWQYPCNGMCDSP